jgi:hypothetical protein
MLISSINNECSKLLLMIRMKMIKLNIRLKSKIKWLDLTVHAFWNRLTYRLYLFVLIHSVNVKTRFIISVLFTVFLNMMLGQAKAFCANNFELEPVGSLEDLQKLRDGEDPRLLSQVANGIDTVYDSHGNKLVYHADGSREIVEYDPNAPWLLERVSTYFKSFVEPSNESESGSSSESDSESESGSSSESGSGSSSESGSGSPWLVERFVRYIASFLITDPVDKSESGSDAGSGSSSESSSHDAPVYHITPQEADDILIDFTEQVDRYSSIEGKILTAITFVSVTIPPELWDNSPEQSMVKDNALQNYIDQFCSQTTRTTTGAQCQLLTMFRVAVVTYNTFTANGRDYLEDSEDAVNIFLGIMYEEATR